MARISLSSLGARPEQQGALGSPVGPGLLEAVIRFRWLIVAASVAAALAGLALSLLQATTYVAEARMLLVDPRTSRVFEDVSSGVGDLSRYVRNQTQFLESSAVAERAIEVSGLELSTSDVLTSVSASTSRDSDLVTITATQPTGYGAAALANAVGEAYQLLVFEQVQAAGVATVAELVVSKGNLATRLEALEAGLAENVDNVALRAERDAVITQLVGIDTRIEQIDVNMALYGSGVQYFEPPVVPLSPATPKPRRNASAAAIIGLLAASALAWWRTERSPLAENRHDPAPILGAPLLGEVPEYSLGGARGPVPMIHDPRSPAAEAYQFVASSVDLALRRSGGSSFVVTSASAGDGKTVTSLNLAIAAANSGSSVVLVDGDERARGLTRMAGDDSVTGLADLIERDDLRLDDCLVRWRIGDEGYVIMLPAGNRVGASAGLFHGVAFTKIMAEISNRASLVVIDSPPVLAAAESIDIVGTVDGVVVVIDQGTPVDAIAEVRARLDMTSTVILGYVFNRSTRRPGSYGYGYGP